MPMKKVLSFMVSIALVFSLMPASTLVSVEAASKVKTGSKTYSATVGTPSLSVYKANVEGRSTQALFQVSDLPANAKITSIEVHPGGASMGGAPIFTTTWTVRSSSGKTDELYTMNLKGSFYTFRGHNNDNANANYFVSFTGFTTGSPVLFGLPNTTGAKSYKTIKLVINYEY